MKDMLDANIRKAFKEKYLQFLDPEILVFDELGILSFLSIVDIAVIHKDFFQAFEIKSGSDSTARLKNQVKCYNQVFDSITIIADEKHMVHFDEYVPPFWGIIIVKKGLDNKPEFEILRHPKHNELVNKEALCHFFWKEEALAFLKKKGIKGLSKKNKEKLWKMIAEYPIEEIRDAIIFNFKNRKDWRQNLDRPLINK